MTAFFGSYGITVFMGIIGGLFIARGQSPLLVFLLLPAVGSAIYFEYKKSQGVLRKTVAVAVAVIISIALFSAFSRIASKGFYAAGWGVDKSEYQSGEKGWLSAKVLPQQPCSR